jgi:hypothetical protein
VVDRVTGTRFLDKWVPRPVVELPLLAGRLCVFDLAAELPTFSGSVAITAGVLLVLAQRPRDMVVGQRLRPSTEFSTYSELKATGPPPPGRSFLYCWPRPAGHPFPQHNEKLAGPPEVLSFWLCLVPETVEFPWLRPSRVRERLASYHLRPDVLDAAAAMASDQRSDIYVVRLGAALTDSETVPRMMDGRHTRVMGLLVLTSERIHFRSRRGTGPNFSVPLEEVRAIEVAQCAEFGQQELNKRDTLKKSERSSIGYLPSLPHAVEIAIVPLMWNADTHSPGLGPQSPAAVACPRNAQLGTDLALRPPAAPEI